MSNYICLNKICKKYNKNFVINNFSYTFKTNGLYTIFGESGSGKTTLLNIIAGLISFDSGEIYFNNNKYKSLNFGNMSNYISYLTQDVYLIEYLNIYDNLLLCSSDIELINSLIKELDLEKTLKQYPNELSGGEKQRISLIQTILKNKKIIILDEPTSSLDEKSKNKVYKLLNKLKKDHLIICSSHDKDIKKYSDEIIYLNENKFEKTSNTTIECTKENNKLQYNLYDFVKKQNKYYKNKINILLSITLILCFLIIYFSSNTEDKLLTSLQKRYNMNYLTVYCPINSDECNRLFESKEITEYSFIYHLNIPLERSKTEGSVGNSLESNIYTLPLNINNFKLASNIKYGRYIKSKNEIILGIDKALSINKNIELLLNKRITINTVDGENDFIIVGIFDYFDNNEYFKIGQVNDPNNYYFISNEFTKQYIYDDILGYNEVDVRKSVYYVYFDNFNTLYKYYNKYVNNDIYSNNIYIDAIPSYFIEISNQISIFKIILIPIFIISIIVSIIYYFQTMKIDIKYKKHNYATYLYYGYNLKDIKKSTTKNNIINLLKIFIFSFIISLILSFIINNINNYFNIVSYQIFNINIIAVCTFLILLLICSIILSILLSKNIKINGWYNIEKDNGDLL